jgi:hypothetical protein
MRVFLCHSSGDKPAVRELYKRLRADGFAPWLDEESLTPGQEWKVAIADAVRDSDIVIVCLSKSSIGKTGFVQKEIAFALDRADEQPEGSIYLIPARLEECEVPKRLGRWHWIDLFASIGYQKLVRALRAHKSFRPPQAREVSNGFSPFSGTVLKGDSILCRRCEQPFDPADRSFSCSHHTEPPVVIGNTGPARGYADIWRFPCCGKTLVGEISERGNDVRPPMSPGCATSMHVPYEA